MNFSCLKIHDTLHSWFILTQSTEFFSFENQAPCTQKSTITCTQFEVDSKLNLFKIEQFLHGLNIFNLNCITLKCHNQSFLNIYKTYLKKNNKYYIAAVKASCLVNSCKATINICFIGLKNF